MALRFSLGAALVLLLALLSERRARARAASLGLTLRPTSLGRRALAALAAAAAAALGTTSAWALGGAVALLLSVPWLLWTRPAPAARARRGQLVPLTAAELAALVRPHADGASVFDATSARGASVLVCAIALLASLPDAFELTRDPYGLALACALPCWFSGAHLALPRGYRESAGLLLRALEASALRGCAFRLLARLDDRGARSEPRVRVEHAGRYPGLVRLEVLIDTRRERAPFLLCATVRAGSLASRWIVASRRDLARVDGAGGRSALLWSIPELDAGIVALFALLDRESQQAIERMVSVSLQAA